MALRLKFIQKIAATLLPATTTSHLDCCSSLLTVLSVFILANPPLTFPSPPPTAARNPTHKPSHIIPYSKLLVGSHMIWEKSQIPTVTHMIGPLQPLWPHLLKLSHMLTCGSTLFPFCSQTPPASVLLFLNVLLPGGISLTSLFPSLCKGHLL